MFFLPKIKPPNNKEWKVKEGTKVTYLKIMGVGVGCNEREEEEGQVFRRWMFLILGELHDAILLYAL